MVSSTELENAIRSKVQNVSALVVSDVSGGCGQAYDVVIVSEAFEGLPTLKRHRMVNELLKDQIAELHAFSQKTYTPKQYESMASKDSSTTSSTSTSTTSTTPAQPSSTSTNSSEAQRFLSTLDTTSPVPSKNSNRSHHRTRSSNVSVPELTLTTDVDDENDQNANTPGSKGHGRKPSGGSGSGGSPSPRSVAQSLEYDAFNDGGILPQSPSLPNISRLLHGKVTSPDFWQELHTFLLSQTSVANAAGAASPTLPSGSTSPSPSSPSLNRRPIGASEAEKLWEDFFQSQKQYLTASEAAKIRDVTGLFGLGGQ